MTQVNTLSPESGIGIIPAHLVNRQLVLYETSDRQVVNLVGDQREIEYFEAGLSRIDQLTSATTFYEVSKPGQLTAKAVLYHAFQSAEGTSRVRSVIKTLDSGLRIAVSILEPLEGHDLFNPNAVKQYYYEGHDFDRPDRIVAPTRARLEQFKTIGRVGIAYGTPHAIEQDLS